MIAGSARILAALEERFPDPPLLPAAPDERRRALEICAHFDHDVGVAARAVLFSELIHEPGYLCRVFSEGKPAAVRLLYRASFPLARRMVAKGNGLVDPAGVARAFEVTHRALDVARAAEATGYMVGDSFSVADLTCAALLGVLTAPPHPDMQRPGPVPERVATLLARFAPHPAIAWVHAQYRKHRPARAPLPD